MGWINRNLSLVILIGFIILTSVLGYLYFRNDYSAKIGNILGGSVAGLLIAILQYAISIDEKIKLDKIKSLKVKNVLFARGDETYYRILIESSKINIWVMGVTAIRFLEDFANSDTLTLEKKVIFQALMRNVDIRILLPQKQFLTTVNDEQNFDKSGEKMRIIHALYPKNFNFKYFQHEPAHSIFRVDDETIIGPVIPNKSSKDTPGIHILNSSKYATTYLDYFDAEWHKAKEI